MMEQMVASFTDYLKTNEMEISTSLKVEFVSLLPYIDTHDRKVFQETMRQLWIKDPYDYPRFDECFYEFFFKEAFVISRQQEKTRKEEQLKHMKGSITEKVNEEWDNTQTSAKWIEKKLSEKKTQTARILNEFHQKNIHRLLDQPTWTEKVTPASLKDAVEELMWDALCDDQPSVVSDQLIALGEFAETMRNEVLKIKTISHELIQSTEKDTFVGKREVIKTEIDELKERDIARLKRHEITRLQDYINTTSVHFLTQMGRILRVTKPSDDIDMPKTMSESLKTFGVPMELYYKKPKINKTKIHLLLDVSGSVIKSAEFLSLFAYLLHQRFPGQVRSFVFVGKLDEVTNYYKLDQPSMAVEFSLRKAAIDYKGYSNYNEAFSMYEKEFLQDVDNDTIVMMLGDARNNKNQSRHQTVQRIQQQCKRLFWLNPETKEKWNKGDSMLSQYEPFCDGIYETRTLEQLEHSLQQITDILAN